MSKKTVSILSYLATPGALALAAMFLYSLSAQGGGGNRVTKVQTLNVQETVSSPVCYVGILPTNGATLTDWNPTCQNGTTLSNNTQIWVQAGDNVGSVITGIDGIDGGPSTTIAVASNGQTLPQATINVTSTAGFVTGLSSVYIIYVTTGGGQQTVSCTGSTSTTFTGCTGGAGLMTTGNAVLGGLPTGTMRTICNINAPADDGRITFPIEDTSSKANNRIWADNSASSIFTDRFGLDTGSCAGFIYTQPQQADPTMYRWIPLQSVTGIYHAMIQNFELWPRTTPPAITGTNNNYGPDINCTHPVVGTPTACEAGGSGLWVDYSVAVLTTVDASGATITGMTGPGGNSGKGEGTIKMLLNGGPGPITITNQDGGSLAANRFLLPNNASITIPVNEIRMFFTGGAGWTMIGSGFTSTATTANALIKLGANSNTQVSSNVLDNGTGTTIGALSVQDLSTQNTQTFVSIVPNGTGLTSNAGNDLLVIDNRTFNTTGGAISVVGIASTIGATRSAGAPNLTSEASVFQCAGAQVNYAQQTTGGDEYHGLGAPMNNFLVNMATGHYLDTSQGGKIETTLFVGGGDFSTTTHQEACAASVLPTANHGTLSADSSNCIGEITAIGANTSVTLTFNGAFGTTSHCYVTVEGATPAVITVSTVSASAPIFSCFDMAGVALNCPNFVYHCWGH